MLEAITQAQIVSDSDTTNNEDDSQNEMDVPVSRSNSEQVSPHFVE